MNVPPKARRAIEAVLDLHPGDIEIRMDERLEDGAFYLSGAYGEVPFIVGSTRMVNYARDIRGNVFVPEVWADEASTWS